MDVERWRIAALTSFKSYLAAPKFDAALEVRVKNPHAIRSPRLWMEPAFSPRLNYMQSGDARGKGECGNCSLMS